MNDMIGSTFAANYADAITVAFDRDSDPEGDALLELVISQNEDVLTLRFDPRQARKLRLLIQKYERNAHRQEEVHYERR